jgi:hypothetical protein
MPRVEVAPPRRANASSTGRREIAAIDRAGWRACRPFPSSFDAFDVDLDLDPTLDVDGNVVV